MKTLGVRVICVGGILIVALSEILLAVNSGAVVFGVRVGSTPVYGAANMERAISLYTARTHQTITLAISGKQFTVIPAEVGITVNESETVAAVQHIGHSRDIFTDWYEQVRALTGGERVTPVIQTDPAALNNFLYTTLASAQIFPVDATVSWSGEEFVVHNAGAGKVVSASALMQEIIARITGEQSFATPIALAVEQQNPSITTAAAMAVAAQANGIIARAPFALSAQQDATLLPAYTISADTAARWLSFQHIYGMNNAELLKISPNDAAIKQFLDEINNRVARAAHNAVLGYQSDKAMQILVPAVNGQTVDATASVALISKGLLSGDVALHYAVQTLTPTVSAATLQNLGVDALLAADTTNFSGSPQNRVRNITIGAAKYNNVIIQPNEEFSFDKTLGPVDASAGYLPELVIVNNETVPQYGGGLCQVSTTVFQAAVKAGLDITERSPHAYVVEYYGTPGFDATIYPPQPDLRFINNTASPIVMQTYIKGNTLTVELFGRSDGRFVTLDGPHIYDAQPDGALKAWLKETVMKGGKVFWQQTFWSSYNPPSDYPLAANPLE